MKRCPWFMILVILTSIWFADWGHDLFGDHDHDDEDGHAVIARAWRTDSHGKFNFYPVARSLPPAARAIASPRCVVVCLETPPLLTPSLPTPRQTEQPRAPPLQA